MCSFVFLFAFLVKMPFDPAWRLHLCPDWCGICTSCPSHPRRSCSPATSLTSAPCLTPANHPRTSCCQLPLLLLPPSVLLASWAFSGRFVAQHFLSKSKLSLDPFCSQVSNLCRAATRTDWKLTSLLPAGFKTLEKRGERVLVIL